MKSSRTSAPLLRSTKVSYICASCPRTTTSTSRRAFASSARRGAAAAPPPASGYARLSNRRLISLSGPDTIHFLQGVITADIAPAIPRTSGCYAGILNAKGRVVNDVFIYPDIYGLVEQSGKFKDSDGKRGERWIVEVDALEVEELYKHLRRYKLRAKLDLRVLGDEEMGVWQSWMDTPAQEEGKKGWTAHTISSTGAKDEGLITLADSRAPGMGKRILMPGSSLTESVVDGLEESTLDAYTIRRYLRGVPEGQGEILKEIALAQESNIDYMGGISYRKGCYVGQELTIRTHHMGVVRKRILPIMLYPAGQAAPDKLEYRQDAGVEIPTLESKMERAVNQTTAEDSGAKQFPSLEAKRAGIKEKTGDTGDVGLDKSKYIKKEKKARGLGKFLTGVGNVGLGICRLEAAQDGFPYEVKWEVEGVEKGVGVKAFVPSWHLKDKE